MSRQNEIARVVHVRWGWPQKTAWLASEWIVSHFAESDVVPVDGQRADAMKHRVLRERPDVMASLLKELANAQITFAQRIMSWIPKASARGIVPADALALMLILDASGGSTSMIRIRELFAPLAQATVSGIVERAIVAKLITREKSKTDARYSLVSLTSVGRRELQRTRAKAKQEEDA